MTDLDMNIFEIILDLETARGKFLDIRNLRRKQVPIESMWSSVIERSLLEDLVKLIKITHLLFKRYTDEYNKSKSSNKEPESKLIHYIQRQIKFCMELIVLLEIYSSYYSHLDIEPQSKLLGSSMITIEDTYKDLIQFFLNCPELRDNEDLIQYFKFFEERNSSNRIRSKLDLFDEDFQLDQIQIKLTMADSYQNIINNFFVIAESDFWYTDDLMLMFLNGQALEIYDQLVAMDQSKLDFQTKSILETAAIDNIPLIEAQTDFAKARFQFTLARTRINSFEFLEASIELKSSIGSLETVFNTLGMTPKTPKMKRLRRDAQRLFEEVQLYNLLVQLAIKYEQLITIISTNFDFKVIQNQLNEITSTLRAHDYNLDIQYLSAMPPLYENSTSILELMIAEQAEEEVLYAQVLENFEHMERRIITATNQIVETFDEFSTNYEEESPVKTRQLLNQIEILQLTNSLLPKQIPSKNHNHNRLKILFHLASSYDFEMQAFGSIMDNKIKELIYKTKAYHHANQAYFEFNNLGTEDVPIDRIRAHYSGSFISANRLQIQVYKSIAQYLCLNEVLPILYQINSIPDSSGAKNEIYENWQQRLQSKDLYLDILNQIIHGCQILREHRQIHGNIISGIDWSRIEEDEKITRGIIHYHRSLNELLLGHVAHELGMKEDAIIHFTEAKDLGFSSADLLQPLSEKNNETKSAPTMVYNYAKFCQTSSINPTSHDLAELPITGAFKLLRDLTFNL